jgi:hypothetical protein
VTVLLVAAALIAGTGAIAALAPIDARLGLVGLTASLVAAGLLGDPLPSPTVLGIRLSAALLAVVTLRAASRSIAGRDAETGRGWSRHERSSPLGWPAEILLGTAGGAAGLAIAHQLAIGTLSGTIGLVASPAATDLLASPGLALGAAGLMLAGALGPALFERVGLRRAIAVVLVTEAVMLARVALAPPPTVVAEVIDGLLLVAVAAAGAMLAADPAAPGPARRP